MSSQWVRSENVVWQEFDGEAVIVSTTAQKTWVLNASASQIWKCCDGRITLDGLASRLAKAGGREVSRVKGELLAFFRMLEGKGLIRASHIAAASILEDRLTLELSVAGLSLPPLIKMESNSVGIRGRPSPRGNTGGQ